MTTRRLQSEAQAIKALQRDVRDLQAKLGRVGSLDAVRFKNLDNTSSEALEGAGSDHITLTFTPPSGWGGYELSATSVVTAYGDGDNYTFNASVRIDGDSGGTMSRGGNALSKTLCPSHLRTGLSGAVDVVLRLSTSVAGEGTAQGARLSVVARRTS